MHRRIASSAVAALLLVWVVTSSARADGWAGVGIVRAPGGPYLSDGAGRRLTLHGVNLVAKCGGGAVDEPVPGTPCVGPDQGPGLAYVLSPSAADPGRRFTAADARTLARLGFNVVRLGIVWEGLEPGPAQLGPNDPRICAPHRPGTPFPSLGPADPYRAAVVAGYLRRTDRIVRELARAGLRVIIDMHSDAWGSAFSESAGATPWNGEGAPPWATCVGRHHFTPTPGWGSAYTQAAVQTAIHHFWANDVRGDLLGQYARVWRAVANHFRGDRAVLGYELYNEPNDFRMRDFDRELQCDYVGRRRAPVSCSDADHPDVPAGGLIGAVRSVDPEHVVFYEPSGATDYGATDTVGVTEPLRVDDLALAFHAYGDLSLQLHQTAAERARTRLPSAGGPAWVMDEFGASGDAHASAAAVDNATALDLSWVYWSAMQLNDPTGGADDEGLLDQATRAPRPALARALAVPYPWATSGTPGAQSFDRRTGVYRYAFTVDHHIHVPSEIELPGLVYPHGLTVTVTGARVVGGGHRAGLLYVAAKVKARVVSVVVRPEA